nr:hypothetical protein [uncultured Bacteroides sp.]
MSELNFDISGNNADFIKQATQIGGAIDDLGTEFKTLSANTEICTETMEVFFETMKKQIDSTVEALNKMNIENQVQLSNLQSLSSVNNVTTDVDTSQEVAIQAEVSARKELAQAIETQLGGLNKLVAEILEYEQLLKRTKETQTAFDSGLKAMEDELNGTAGIFTVASGAMDIFGVESEFLEKAMQKVQAAIAVTNGLQAISTALSKEAAFQQNVLGKIKLWWKGITLQAAAAQGVETATAQVGTIANLGLAGAFRAVGLAIKSIPVFGWIAAGISALITLYSLWSSSTDEQIEKQEDLSREMDDFNNSVQSYAAKPIATIEILSNKFKALGNNVEAQKKFIVDNKSAFDELGQSITGVSDAQRLLIDNKDKFIQAQIAKATSLAYMDKVQEEAKKYVQAKTAADIWEKAATMRSYAPERKKEYEQRSANYNKTAGAAQSQMRRYTTLGMSQSLLSDELMPESKTNKTLPKNTQADIKQKQLQLQKLLSKQSLEGDRSAQELWNEIWQDEIDAMDNGSEKTLAQMQLNHEKQLQALDKEKEDLLLKRKEEARAVFDAQEDLKKAKNPDYVKETFDDSKIILSETDNAQFNQKYAAVRKRQKKETEAYYASEKQAMNEALAAYGSYEQKCLAIKELAEAKKIGKIKEEQDAIDKQTSETLATLEKEANKEKNVFVKLFGDMKDKSVGDMRKIANHAEKALTTVKSGKWNTTIEKDYGIGENTFNQLHNSKEEIKKAEDAIKELRSQADQCDTAFNKISIGFDKLFESGSDSKKLNEALSLIESGLNEVMQTGKFLSSTLSGLGDAFGSEALGKAAEGINIAMDTASAAMSGAKAGAMFGPWGAAAGAAVGLVSSLAGSLAKLHDARHEKSIKKIQDQIEVLEKSYKNLGDSLEKAYSADASKLIEQQNTLLEQQKVLIQNQIAEEKSKKKADAGRIKDWENQIEDINKLIGDNKEKQIDAILGSDVKSAIDDFAQAYADAWAVGDDKAKSSKELVKQMIKQMILEAMKATSSKPMEALRNKLASFFSDGIISAWEREQIEKDAEALTKELDGKYGWADEYLKGDEEATTQDSTRGGFESMSQETGTELNGRFTALQTSNEEIKNSMLLALGNLSVLCTTASDGNILLTEMRNLAVMSNSHLEDIARYTKPILGFGEKLDKIERNTANL